MKKKLILGGVGIACILALVFQVLFRSQNRYDQPMELDNSTPEKAMELFVRSLEEKNPAIRYNLALYSYLKGLDESALQQEAMPLIIYKYWQDFYEETDKKLPVSADWQKNEERLEAAGAVRPSSMQRYSGQDVLYYSIQTEKKTIWVELCQGGDGNWYTKGVSAGHPRDANGDPVLSQHDIDKNKELVETMPEDELKEFFRDIYGLSAGLMKSSNFQNAGDLYHQQYQYYFLLSDPQRAAAYYDAEKDVYQIPHQALAGEIEKNFYWHLQQQDESPISWPEWFEPLRPEQMELKEKTLLDNGAVYLEMNYYDAPQAETGERQLLAVHKLELTHMGGQCIYRSHYVAEAGESPAKELIASYAAANRITSGHATVYENRGAELDAEVALLMWELSAFKLDPVLDGSSLDHIVDYQWPVEFHAIRGTRSIPLGVSAESNMVNSMLFASLLESDGSYYLLLESYQTEIVPYNKIPGSSMLAYYLNIPFGEVTTDYQSYWFEVDQVSAERLIQTTAKLVKNNRQYYIEPDNERENEHWEMVEKQMEAFSINQPGVEQEEPMNQEEPTEQ